MEIKITSKEEKPLLSRTEVSGEIGFEKETPSRTALKDKIAGAVKANSELVVVKSIDTTFGMKKAKFMVYAYKSAKELELFEADYSRKRNKYGEKKAEPEAKQEKPVEAKKPEEMPAEKKE